MSEQKPKYGKTKTIEQPMPKAKDVEGIVLGVLMIEPASFLQVVGTLTIETFYEKEHQYIFEAIEHLQRTNSKIDILTVKNHLKNTDKLELVGGAYYLTQLTSRVTSSANLDVWCKILQQKFIQRELIRTATEQLQLAYDESNDIEMLTDYINEQNSYINSLSAGGSHEVGMISGINSAKNKLAERIYNHENGIVIGIPTGFCDLDKLLISLVPKVYIIAARPSVGKTSFALELAKKSIKLGKHCHFKSLEMEAGQLIDKLILAESGVNADKYYSGSITHYDADEINSACERLAKLDTLYIDDKFNQSISKIHSQLRIAKNKDKCDIVFIDYLGLIETNKAKNKTKTEEIAEITRALVYMKKDLQIPIIILAQLNRDLEKRPNKKPQLSDLKDSGAIEADAEVVMLLHRPALFGLDVDENGKSTKGQLDVIIAKNRGGRIGDVTLFHNENFTKFYDNLPDNSMQENQSFDMQIETRITPNHEFETQKF